MEPPTRYKLQVRLEIVKEEWVGPLPANKSNNEGYWTPRMNERLAVSEDLELGALDFLGVMKVLGNLHESIKRIKADA